MAIRPFKKGKLTAERLNELVEQVNALNNMTVTPASNPVAMFSGESVNKVLHFNLDNLGGGGTLEIMVCTEDGPRLIRLRCTDITPEEE